MKKAIVSLSGGMDSATVLAVAKQDREVIAVSFRYPSKHNLYELQAASYLASHYGIRWEIIDVSPIFELFKSNLLNSGGPIPEGHYEDESMKQTVVPCRNLIFGSVLGGLAVSEGIDEIWLGVHAGDHAIYPDCRPRFIITLGYTIRLASDSPMEMKAPFLNNTKKEILATGLTLNVPYQFTRTCYKDQSMACGKCGSCTERLEAFASVGVKDPIEYEQ